MIRFADVNKANSGNYLPHFQRHHLIPMQVASNVEISNTLNNAFAGGFGFNNFGENGVLLPSQENVAAETGFPLHRGPHREYNELVIERLLRIRRLGRRIGHSLDRKVFVRSSVVLLQLGLRRGLLGHGFGKLTLNRRDPIRSHHDFSTVDDRLDKLFSITEVSPIPSDGRFSG